MNNYENVLNKLICIYIQMIDLKDQFEENKYELMMI